MLTSNQPTKTDKESSAKINKKPHRNALVSRNITVGNRRTSVRLEPEMWVGLQEICRRERATLHQVGTEVAKAKPDNASLTAALRVFVMAYFRAASTEEGHGRAGHGQGVETLVRAAPPLTTLTPSYAAVRMAQSQQPAPLRQQSPSFAGGSLNRRY